MLTGATDRFEIDGERVEERSRWTDAIQLGITVVTLSWVTHACFLTLLRKELSKELPVARVSNFKATPM